MRNATLKDVAAAAGVGVSTASYVLSGSGLNKVGVETAKRIREIAEKLNYRPNSVARELKSGQSRLIALLVSGVNYSFMPDLLQEIEEVLADNHYNALFSIYRTPDEFAERCRNIAQQRIAGGIVSTAGNAKLLKNIEHYFPGIPWMVCSSKTSDAYPAVWVPPEEVGRIGLDLLYRNNHRRIACFDNASDRWSEAKSVAGKYHANVDDIVWLESEYSHIENVWKELDAIKKHTPEKYPTAIFFPGDNEAVEFMSICRRRNIRVPEDISILSVNGSPLCQWVTPHLTSIAQPRGEQGTLAVERLLDWIKTGIRPETLELHCSIQEGQSIRTLPAIQS